MTEPYLFTSAAASAFASKILALLLGIHMWTHIVGLDGGSCSQAPVCGCCGYTGKALLRRTISTRHLSSTARPQCTL